MTDVDEWAWSIGWNDTDGQKPNDTDGQKPNDTDGQKPNDTDGQKPKHRDHILSYSHFAQHKSYMHWPGIETRPPWWGAAWDTERPSTL
jgi:hypothetical protein